MSTTTAWVGILAFTFQIYFDFSGYSDMAIGLGKMMGFTFPENFRYPYSSHSISEFWRRWHITLGAWFKNYVYFPLGGNRKGGGRTIFNLAVVWLLTGIWHGASWNFILWGVIMGFFVIMEKLFLSKVLKKLPWIFSSLYVMFIVTILWVPFDLPTIGDSVAYIKVMFGTGGNGFLLDQKGAYYITQFAVIFIICIFAASETPKDIIVWIRRRCSPLIDYGAIPVILAIFTACTAYLVNSGYNPFLYFNF
jgi:alginate O-acetyltransferase complex protein AlgI